MYRIARVRLINFHNFVDETIDIPDGGHLFLLGDNGSGKSTVLDAVQYVLSGGDALELNAAARLAGARDEGRSIQGIVLRHDCERGVLNDGGATAYAAIELADTGAGRRMCLGIGTAATTMEARVVRWGFLYAKPLEEVPLLVAAAQGDAPCPRDDLRERLGRNHVFFQMTEYRKAVARRLFGSGERYREVCGFWSMAKAYREIVASSRDFGALFARLLPAPDGEVFGDIVRSLRAVDELAVKLGEIEEQRAYVAGLLELAKEVDSQREARARYTWLLHLRERAEAEAEGERNRQEMARLAERVEAIGLELRGAKLRLEEARDALEQARARDRDGLLDSLRQAEARVAELGLERDGCERELEEVRVRRGACQAELQGALRALREHLGRARDALVHAVRAARDTGPAEPEAPDAPGAPDELMAVHAFADAIADVCSTLERASRAMESDAASAAAHPLSGDPGALELAARDHEARLALRRARDRAEDRLRAERLHQADAGREHERATRALAAIQARGEELPEVAGFAEVRAEIARQGLVARPIYELLEPRQGAEPRHVAAIEALAGDAALAALVTDAGQAPALRDRVTALAAGVRVIVRTAEDAALPPWMAAIFDPSGDTAQRTALRALAAAVSRPRSLGTLAPPDDADVLEHGGAAFRMAAREPRLLGSEARRRAHEAREAEAEAEVASAAAALDACARRVQIAAGRIQRLDDVATSIDALGRGPVRALQREVEGGVSQWEHLRALLERAGLRAEQAVARLADAEMTRDALNARVCVSGLDRLEEHLRELRGRVSDCDEAVRTLDNERAVANHQVEERGQAEQIMRERVAALTRAMDAAAAALRRHVDAEVAGSDEALERYVRVTMRGDTFRSVDAIRQRMIEAERREQSAADELERDGARGVRNIHHAARFGFGYDRAANRIEDRHEQSAAGVAAELARTIEEQRQVVNESTRELMDKLIMGNLARHLQGQVERLHLMHKDINRLLERLRFGAAQYRFQVSPRAERRELVDLVRRISILDQDARQQFRAWIDEHIAELRAAEHGAVPEILDYRTWFHYGLHMRTSSAEGVELTRKLRGLGSGGEQGVPNYLLVLALAHLMFENASARVRPLLFDEAFYGIDAGRRDELLRFATELGLQLVIASPDQDGVTPAVRHATTLFLVKDANGDVHLAPYHYWNRAEAQPGLFADPAAAPDPADATCRLDAPAR